MGAALSLQALVASDWQVRPEPELLPTGIPGIELPRGCMTEVIGQRSSGRATLMMRILAAATSRGEICALVDAEDAFDPASAAAAGVDLARVLWVRCGNGGQVGAEHALKAADLLIQGGGLGVVVMDLGETPPHTARRISLTSWFRLRRAVEHTPAVLVVVAQQSNAKTCASLVLECRRERARWSGAAPGRLMRGFEVRATASQRSRACSHVFTARAI